MLGKSYITLPYNSNITILKKYNTYYLLIKTTKNFFLYKVNVTCLNFLQIDSWSNSINLLLHIKQSNNSINILNYFFFNWNNFDFNKIRFTGKGYKLDKYFNRYYFFFNYSHIKLLKTKNIINFRLKKQKLLFIWKKTKKMSFIMTNIVKLRYLNKYTKRGLRFSRMYVLTKNKRKK